MEIRSFYRLLVPNSIRSNIYKRARAKIEADIEQEKAAIKSAIQEIDFFVDLDAEHINNLRVFIDREAMLEAFPKGGTVAELGVADGSFSGKILSITKPSKLHLIDVWESERYPEDLMTIVREKFREGLKTGQVVINRGYSTLQLKEFPDRYFDWVYIDTDHSYATTVQELALCRRKVKVGGLIAGHDYVTGGWASRFRYGVVEAVHEFCIKYDWEMLLLTHEGDRHLSFAIRKREA